MALAAPPAAARRGKVSREPARAPLIGKTPALYGRLAPLRFGMTRAAAEQAAPGLFDPRRSRRDMVMYGLEFDEASGLREVAMHFLLPHKGVRKGLSNLWGAPRRCDPRLKMLKGQRWWVWLNPADGVRVMLRDTGAGAGAIHFAPYVPLEQQLGKAGGPLGFEATAPVIGTPLAALQASFGDALRRAGERWTLELPAHEYGPSGKIALRVQGGVARGASLPLSYAHCGQARGAILAALTARYGVFAPPVPGGDAEVLTAGPTRIQARDTGREIVVDVGAP